MADIPQRWRCRFFIADYNRIGVAYRSRRYGRHVRFLEGPQHALPLKDSLISFYCN